LNISFYEGQANSLLEEETVSKFGHKIHAEHMTTFYSRITDK
jgi:hypothetical protein